MSRSRPLRRIVSFLRPWMGLVAILTIGSGDSCGQGSQRYQSEIFTTYQLQSNLQYGQAVSVTGGTVNLLLDIYKPPSTDTVTNRPLVIFIHGGGFQSGDKVSNFGTRVCGSFARRGYVVASINYRLSPGSYLTSDTAYFQALYRAIQDGKAAVRYFRRYGSDHGVDTSQVFVTGSSAGSKTALHMAFLTQEEVPAFINPGQIGTLEGVSGNPGHWSEVQGVINCWGALWDYRWINAGDVPVFCVHGTSDTTVPYDSSFSYHGFKYGSTIIHGRASNVGVSSGLRLFYNTGHTLDNNAAKQDSAIRDFAAWLFTILRLSPTGVGPSGGSLQPSTPWLEQNYPNPFNPTTTIEYVLPRAEYVTLDVYSSAGQRVATLVEGYQPAALHRVRLDGSRLASGMYLCRLHAGAVTEQRKMVLTK